MLKILYLKYFEEKGITNGWHPEIPGQGLQDISGFRIHDQHESTGLFLAAYSSLTPRRSASIAA